MNNHGVAEPGLRQRKTIFECFTMWCSGCEGSSASSIQRNVPMAETNGREGLFEGQSLREREGKSTL